MNQCVADVAHRRGTQFILSEASTMAAGVSIWRRKMLEDSVRRMHNQRMKIARRRVVP